MKNKSDDWYVLLQFGIELGPMPRDNLDELAATGQLLSRDSVREGVDGEWFLVEDLHPLIDRTTEGHAFAESRPTETPAEDNPNEPAPGIEAADSTKNDQRSLESVVPESNRADESACGLPVAQSMDEVDYDTGPPAVNEDFLEISLGHTSTPLTGKVLGERASAFGEHSEGEPDFMLDSPKKPEELPSIEQGTAKRTLSDLLDSMGTQKKKPAETIPPAFPVPMTPSEDTRPLPEGSEEENVALEALAAEMLGCETPVSSLEQFSDCSDGDATAPAVPINSPPARAIPYPTCLEPLPSTEQSARLLSLPRLRVPRMATLIRPMIAVAAIVGLLNLISGGPEPDIHDEYSANYYIYAEYAAIYSELKERRNNTTDLTGWMSFVEHARSQIDEYNGWVEESDDPGGREKTLLLGVGRDMQALLSTAPDAESPHQERLDSILDQLSIIYRGAR